MLKATKREQKNSAVADFTKVYSLDEAIGIAKKCATAKFDETVDVAVRLGVDSKKSEQAVRGATNLPHGTGRTVRVAVFAPAEKADAAREAGADIAGMEDLAESIKAGNMDFDVVIATPDAMRLVGQLGQVLGPRGLMPNPKVGTVTPDVVTAVKSAKSGQALYRTDKNGIIHFAAGKISFEPMALRQNIEAVLQDLKKAKPSTAKGTYLKKLTLSTTMGPGIVVDISSIVS
jgi:large subunit ribosomal protein L1